MLRAVRPWNQLAHLPERSRQPSALPGIGVSQALPRIRGSGGGGGCGGQRHWRPRSSSLRLSRCAHQQPPREGRCSWNPACAFRSRSGPSLNALPALSGPPRPPPHPSSFPGVLSGPHAEPTVSPPASISLSPPRPPGTLSPQAPRWCCPP